MFKEISLPSLPTPWHSNKPVIWTKICYLEWQDSTLICLWRENKQERLPNEVIQTSNLWPFLSRNYNPFQGVYKIKPFICNLWHLIKVRTCSGLFSCKKRVIFFREYFLGNQDGKLVFSSLQCLIICSDLISYWSEKIFFVSKTL